MIPRAVEKAQPKAEVNRMTNNGNSVCKRRAMAATLTLLMVLGAAADGLAAQAEAGKANTASTDAAVAETTSQDDTINYETIYIENVENFLEFAKSCSLDTWSQGKEVVLLSDISVGGTDFVNIPIFSGVFDGSGYTVSGLNLSDSCYPSGLFGIIQTGAVVKNLNVDGTVSPSGDAEAVGGIVGINYGTISACTFTGTVCGESSTGGIVGMNGVTGTINGCKSFGGVFGQHATGGIIGTNLGAVNGCTNSCYVNIVSIDPTFAPEDLEVDLTQSIAQFASADSLSASTDTGGVAGYSSGLIKHSQNGGSIGYRHIGYNVGGIVGRSCGHVLACINTGAVYGRKDVGGVIGQMEPYIDSSLSVDLLSQLQTEIDEMTALIDEAIDDTDGSVQTAASRLNKMADYMDAAANAVGNMTAYASVVSSITGSGSVSGSGSGEATAPSVSVSGDGDSGIEVSGDPVSVEGESSASAQGTVSATSQIKVNASQHKLSAALFGMTNQLRLLNGEMSGASATLSDDVRAINDQADKIAGTVMELFAAVENGDTDSLITDASDVNVEAVTYGKATAFVNCGNVYGDIDVGGIAGSIAIEYELDPEDDVSSELSAGVQSRYELKAIIQGCRNSGSVAAKRDCVGGICGRMDLGLILCAEAYGSIESENGDYVGGISGLSKSVIRSCYAKCTLSGRRYVGGVTGSGSDADENRSGSVTQKCCTIVLVRDYSQYAGAISGSDAGEFSDNYFVSDNLTGLGMSSYTGRAEPIEYSKLMKSAVIPSDLRSFSLSFVADGVVVDSIAFNYDDSFDESVFPTIPTKAGYYSEWDTDELNNIHFDTVVTAVYTPYITALSVKDCRGNTRPILYVEGAFCEDDEVMALAQAKTPSEFEQLADSFEDGVLEYFSYFKRGELPQMYVCREIVEQWRVMLPNDGRATHTIRYLSPDGDAKNLKVYCKRDGQWSSVDSEAVGSYLSFDVDGNDVEFAVLSVYPVWWLWIVAAVLLLIIILLIVKAIRKVKGHRRGTKSATEATPNAAEKQDETMARALAAEEKLRQAEEELRVLRAGNISSPVTPDSADTTDKSEDVQPKVSEARPKRKRRGRAFIVVLIVMALLAAAGAILFLNSDLRAGAEALYLLKNYARCDTINMQLLVQTDVDGEHIEAEAFVSRVTESGLRITRIEQDGICLYHADDTIFLENGKAYAACGLLPDYSKLLDKVLDVYSITEVSAVKSNSGNAYTITSTGSNAMELLRLLLPAYADKLSSAQSVDIILTETGGKLSELRFSGSGTLNDERRTAVTVTADLTLLSSDAAAVIPQEVMNAALDNDSADTAESCDDAFRLIQAWAELEARDPLYAGIHLTADCGPLLLDDESEYFRVVSDGTEINCVRRNGFAVYFTEDKYCLADGSSASSSDASVARSAQLLRIAYELCLNGDMRCEGDEQSSTYTLALDKEGMSAVAKAIAADTESMDIDFSSGSVQVVVENGVIRSVRFAVGGNTQIVIVQTDISLSADISFDDDTENKDCTVPDAAAVALKD